MVYTHFSGVYIMVPPPGIEPGRTEEVHQLPKLARLPISARGQRVERPQRPVTPPKLPSLGRLRASRGYDPHLARNCYGGFNTAS